MKQIPKRLGKDPIVSAAIEMRFKSSSNVSTLLPGLLFKSFGDDFPIQTKLPVGNIPEELRKSDPNLANAPLVALSGEKLRIGIGDAAVGIECHGTYVGWPSFKEVALRVIRECIGTKLISEVERVSVKYINFIPHEPTPRPTNRIVDLEISLGDEALTDHPIQLRTELKHAGCITIVQIVSPASLTQPQGSTNGVVIDIDTILMGPFEDFSASVESHLDRVHDEEKRVFYSLISEETLKSYEPEY